MARPPGYSGERGMRTGFGHSMILFFSPRPQKEYLVITVLYYDIVKKEELVDTANIHLIFRGDGLFKIRDLVLPRLPG